MDSLPDSPNRRPSIAILLVALLAPFGLIGLFILPASGIFAREIWRREHPLENPIPVRSVHDGTLELADGRSLRLAGIKLAHGVTQTQFDAALAVAVQQGVTVTRVLGDGRAMLVAEPRFWNTCGHHGFFTDLAGVYEAWPLSEFLVSQSYAEPDPTQPDLTPLDVWRLQGTTEIRTGSAPALISSTAFAINDGIYGFYDYDEYLAAIWKAPPPAVPAAVQVPAPAPLP